VSLPIRCLGTASFIVWCVFISEGTCLPSRCLAMNYSGFQASCYNGYIRQGQLLSPLRKFILKESDKIQRPNTQILNYWCNGFLYNSEAFDICTTEALFPVYLHSQTTDQNFCLYTIYSTDACNAHKSMVSEADSVSWNHRTYLAFYTVSLFFFCCTAPSGKSLQLHPDQML
jgi:hypothetical protein